MYDIWQPYAFSLRKICNLCDMLSFICQLRFHVIREWNITVNSNAALLSDTWYQNISVEPELG